MEITDANYVPLAAGDQIFGEGQAVYVKITDPLGLVVQSQARTPGASPDFVQGVSARSTTGPSTALVNVDPATAAGTPWTFSLLETGPATGIYTGSFKVSTTQAAGTGGPTQTHNQYASGGNANGRIFGDGVLRVANNLPNTITVSLPQVGTVAALSDTVTWLRATDAAGQIVIQVAPPLVTEGGVTNVVNGYTSRFTFRITDPDLNTNTTHVQTYPIQIFSDADPVGETVVLLESIDGVGGNPPTASNDGSLFVASVGFENASIPVNGKVFVREGDRIFARWVEPRDATGAQRFFELPRAVSPFTFWVFRSTTDSVVDFARAAYFGIDPNPKDPFVTFADKATIQVFDPDRGFGTSNLETVPVTVTSTTDATGMVINLREIRGLSGEFYGDILLNTSAGPLLANTLRVAHGDTLTVTYQDTKDAEGIARTRTDTVRFYVAEGARVILGDDLVNPIGRLAGTSTDHNVHVIDRDANQDPNARETVVVRLKSTSDPTSLLIELEEDADNSGTFVGSFRFSEQSTGGGLLKVADRDQVVAEYIDQTSANGLSDRLLSNTVVWRKPTSPEIFIGADQATASINRYFRKVDFPTAAGDNYGTTARIIVQDQDQNNPAAQDSITVNLAESRLGRSVPITAYEVGIDSGIFVAQAPFGRERADDLDVDGIGNRLFEPIPAIVVTPISGLTTTESGGAAGSATFEVFLTKEPVFPVTLPLSSSNPEEGIVTDVDDETCSLAGGATANALCFGTLDPACPAPNVAQLCFGPTNYHLRQTVTVTGQDEPGAGIADGDTQYSIILSADTTTPEAAYRNLNPNDVAFTNTDEEVSPVFDIVVQETGYKLANGRLFTVERPEDAQAPISGVSGANHFHVSLSAAPATGTTVTVTATTLDTSEAAFRRADTTSASSPQRTATRAQVFVPGSSSLGLGGTGVANWAAAQAFRVESVDDDIFDGDVTYAILLTVSTTDPRFAGAQAMVLVTNFDDETSKIVVSQAQTGTGPGNSNVILESGNPSSATFWAGLTRAPTRQVTIPMGSRDTSEGRLPVGFTSLVLPSQSGTSAPSTLFASISVSAIDDDILDGNIPFLIGTETASSDDASYSGLNPDDVLVVTSDNDVLRDRVLVTPIEGLRLIESATTPVTTSFSITLFSAPTSAVTIPISSSDTSEGTVSPASVTFTSANFNVPRIVTVTSVDDNLVDGNVDFAIVLGAATSNDPVYSAMNPHDVIVTNLDNEGGAPRVRVTPLTGPLTESATTATFQVCLPATLAVGQSVSFPLTSSDLTEGTVSPSTVVLNAAGCGPGQGQVVTVTGVDDRLHDGDIQLAIITGTISSGDGTYNGDNPSDFAVINVDNDFERVAVTVLTGLLDEYLGVAQPQTFEVRLFAQPTSDVTIPLAVTDATEANAIAASLVFTSANYRVPQTVTVSGADDILLDGDATFGIELGAIQSNDPYFRGFNPGDLLATTIDNDLFQAMAFVSPASGNVQEGSATPATFGVVLNKKPTANVFIPLLVSDVTEGKIASPSTDVACPTLNARCLIFTPANYNVPQLVTVESENDLLADGNILFTVTTSLETTDPSFSNVNPSDVVILNEDDSDAGVDDEITITTSAPGGSTVLTEGGSGIQLTVAFNTAGDDPPALQATVIVTLTLSDSSEASFSANAPTSSTTVTFTGVAPQFPPPQFVSVFPAQDTMDDDGIRFSIVTSVSGAVYGDLGMDDFGMTTVDETSGPETLRGRVLAIPASQTVTEGGPATSVNVFLSKPADSPVTIDATNRDLTEAAMSAGAPCLPTCTLTFNSDMFAADAWHAAHVLTVTPADDNGVDGVRPFGISLGAVTGASVGPFANVFGGGVVLSNLDNDGSLLVVSSTDRQTSEAGARSTFTVSLKVPPLVANGFVTVPIASTDFREGEVSPRLLTFTAADWNKAKTVTILGVDDNLPDRDGRYAITLGPFISNDPLFAGRSAGSVRVRNIDDDHSVDFRAEYVDEMASDGVPRPFLSAPAVWTQGPAHQRITFENVASGERLSQVFLDVDLRARQAIQVRVVAYGEFPANSPANSGIGSFRAGVFVDACDSHFTDFVGLMEAVVAMTQDPLNPFRYAGTLTLSKTIPPPDPQWEITGKITGIGVDQCPDGAFPVDGDDTVRFYTGSCFEVNNDGDCIDLNRLNPTNVVKDQLRVRLLPAETFSIFHPATGAPLPASEVFGGAAAGIRVANSIWNEDVNAREFALYDMYQDPLNTPPGSMPSGFPPYRALVVETGANTGEFVGSVGFAPFTASPRGFVQRSDADVGLNLRSIKNAALCFVNSNTIPSATSGRDYAEGLYLISRPACNRVEMGDLNLTSGNTVNARQSFSGDATTGREWLSTGLSSSSLAAANYRRIGTTQIFLDADGDGVVSVRDVRLTDGANVNTNAQTRFCNTGNALPGQGGGGNYPCGQGGTLIGSAKEVEKFWDRNGNGLWDRHESIYLDLDGSGNVSTSDFRLNKMSGFRDNFVEANPAASNYGNILLPGRILVETSLPFTATSQTFAYPRGAVYWLPGSEPTFVGAPGYGLISAPLLEIVDDDSAGYIQREKHVGAGGAAGNTYRPQAGTVHPDWIVVHVNRIETNLNAAPPQGSSQPQVTVGAGAAEPITDRNQDGGVNCVDVTITAAAGAPGSPTCVSVNPTTGVIQVNCPASSSGTCQVNVRYQLRANRATAPSGVSQFRVAEFRDVVFGASVPTDHDIFFTYRPRTLTFPVRSDRTGETELVKFSLPDSGPRRTYLAIIGVELQGAEGNGLVHVATAGGAGDRLRVVYNDARLGDGRPGHPLEEHFRSRLGYVDWHPSQDAVITFHDPSFTTVDSQVTAGSFVQVQVTDVDSDTTGQPDTITVTARNGNNPADQYPVVLRESGPNTGIFQGVVLVNVPDAIATAANRLDISLASLPGSIIVIYDDPQGASGVRAPMSASVNWRPTTTAVATVTPGPIVCPVAGTPTCTFVQGSQSPLIVTVNDQDANRDDRLREGVVVLITTPSDPAGEIVPLTETAANSGIFASTGVRFETTLVPGNGIVHAKDPLGLGESVRIFYEDLRNANGVRQVVEPLLAGQPLPIFWDRTFDGVVSWDRNLYVGVGLPAADASGTVRPATFYVADGDLNRDTRVPDQTVLHFATDVTARVGRIGTDGTINTQPLIVELFETGANTGNFMATFDFTSAATSAPASPVIEPAQGAMGGASVATILEEGKFRAEYVDPVSSTGLPQTFSQEVPWVRAGVGKVFFRDPGYNDRSLRPNLTVIDKDLDTSATTRQTVTVRVHSAATLANSNAALREINVIARESGVNTGIFHTDLDLTAGESAHATATAVARVKVNDIDEIVAVYNDLSPSAQRTAQAHIGIGEVNPPITTLVTAPPTPDGLPRPGKTQFFITDPLVSFTTNKAVKATFVQVGSQGSPQLYQGPFRLAERLGEGLHTIKFWSIDVFDNEETDPTLLIGVDLTAPNQPIVGLTGAPAPNGAAKLNWTPVLVTSNPLEFFDYVIYRDGTTTILAASTAPEYVDSTLTDELTHVYRVAVRDQSGRIGPLSAPVSVIPDKTKPVVSNGIANPSGFDFRSKPATIGVTVSAVDANIDKVVASLTLPNGDVLVSANLARTGGAVFGGRLGTANVTVACTCTLNFTATDKAGNVGELELVYSILGPDNVTPEINIDLPAGAQVVVGAPLSVTVTDNVGLSAIRYRIDGLPFVTVPIAPPNTPTMTFEIDLSSLTLGAHTIEVIAEDNARDANGTSKRNVANRSAAFSIVVELGTVVPPPTTGAGDFFLTTRATVRDDGTILVEWDVPAGLTGSVVAYQVWRASSPFVLIANVTSPDSRSFVDDSAIEGKAYRYVVTYVTAASGLFARLADVPGYPGSDDQVDATGPQRVGDEGVPLWLWVLISVLGLLAIAVLVAVVLASRRGGSQQVVLEQPPAPAEEAAAAEAAQAPAPEEKHRLRCPACEHRFEVSGTKPIVTTCPNCGRKGILR